MNTKEWVTIVILMIVIAVVVAYFTGSITGNATNIFAGKSATYQGVLDMLSNNCKTDDLEFASERNMTCTQACGINGGVAISSGYLAFYKTPAGETDIFSIDFASKEFNEYSTAALDEELIVENLNGVVQSSVKLCTCCYIPEKKLAKTSNLKSLIE